MKVSETDNQFKTGCYKTDNRIAQKTDINIPILYWIYWAF